MANSECVMHTKKIEDIEKRQRSMEISLTNITTTVSHIKDKIDGDSNTITNIWTEINKLVPSVRDNAWWIGKIKTGICWIATVSVGGGLVALAIHFIKNFGGA